MAASIDRGEEADAGAGAPTNIKRTRTKLSPAQEQAFQKWYRAIAEKNGLDPNPDEVEHRYDWRGAWVSGDRGTVDKGDGKQHFDSQYKDDDHPNRFIEEGGGIYDTKYDKLYKKRDPEFTKVLFQKEQINSKRRK